MRFLVLKECLFVKAVQEEKENYFVWKCFEDILVKENDVLELDCYTKFLTIFTDRVKYLYQLGCIRPVDEEAKRFVEIS